MNIQEQILTEVEKYARKKNPEHLQPGLFNASGQSNLEGLGQGHWITIGSDKDPDGDSHGGHPVFVGKDGKMKTGHFAGQSMQEAFGKKKTKPRPKREKQKLGQAKLFGTQEQENLPGFSGQTEAPKDVARVGEKSGIQMPSKTVANEEAKDGDQMGLFGEATKATKSNKWKPTLLDSDPSKGKQKALFDSGGDKDQGLLFGDGHDGPMKAADEQDSKSGDPVGERIIDLSNDGFSVYDEKTDDYTADEAKQLAERKFPGADIEVITHSDGHHTVYGKRQDSGVAKSKSERKLNSASRKELEKVFKDPDHPEYVDPKDSKDMADHLRRVSDAIGVDIREPDSGGKVHLDYDQNRLQIAHNEKPSPDVIKNLKRNGFRWSPKNKAWQRQLTNAAKNAAANITGVKYSTGWTPRLLDRYAGPDQIERYSKKKEPTDAQREAGNYKMRHLRMHGLPITIETPKGQRRRPEWPPMPADYGYIKRTTGKDGDHVDVFLGPNRDSELVVVVDQQDEGGKFDEHKVLLGFTSQVEAVRCYRSAYTRGWKVGPVTSMTIGQFKAWLQDGSQKRRICRQVSRYTIENDDLWLPDETQVDRYDWHSQPREPAGKSTGGQWTTGNRSSQTSPGSNRIAGAFQRPSSQSSENQPSRGQPASKPARSSKVRDVPDRPDTVKPGHSLHHSAMPKEWQQKALNWHAAIHAAMWPVVNAKKDEATAEQRWQSLDKGHIRKLLGEMNRMDREAQSNGVKLHEFVNANGLIPKQLAERLGGGSRFFDPRKISKEQWQAGAKDPSLEEQAQEHAKTFHPGVGSIQSPDKTSSISPVDYWKNKLSGKDPFDGSQPRESGGSPSAESQSQKPQKPQSNPPAKPSSMSRQLEKAVSEALGVNAPQGAVDHFADLVQQAWKQQSTTAEEHNSTLREIAASFAKASGQRTTFDTAKGTKKTTSVNNPAIGALVRWARHGGDTTELKGFDEAVDFANREFPHLKAGQHGESQTGSMEDAIREAFSKGIQQAPKVNDPGVIDQALQMAGPNFLSSLDDQEVSQALSDQEEEEPIPFSLRHNLAVAIEKYCRERGIQHGRNTIALGTNSVLTQNPSIN